MPKRRPIDNAADDDDGATGVSMAAMLRIWLRRRTMMIPALLEPHNVSTHHSENEKENRNHL